MILTDAELDQFLKDIGLKRPRGGSERKALRKKPVPKPKQYLTEEEWQARVAARRSGGETP